MKKSNLKKVVEKGSLLEEFFSKMKIEESGKWESGYEWDNGKEPEVNNWDLPPVLIRESSAVSEMGDIEWRGDEEEWDYHPDVPIMVKEPETEPLSASNEENEIIRSVMRRYKRFERFDADEIISLYQKAKELGSSRLMKLVNQIRTMIKEKRNKGPHMKQQLLEYLVRTCVREVLNQTLSEDDIKGAPAPPAGGQGTADQPEIPKDKTEIPTEPEQPETPPAPDLKGVILVNPKDKSKLQKVQINYGANEAEIERILYRVAASIAGSKVKISSDTVRDAKSASRNMNMTIYLYLGKYDPVSEEIFLMSDSNLSIAKNSSVPPAEVTGAPVTQPSSDEFRPLTADPDEFARRMDPSGRSPVRGSGIDETILKKAVNKMIGEILDKK